MTTTFKNFNNSVNGPHYKPEDSFVSQCLIMVTYTHLAHFRATTYAWHIALEELYTGLQDHADRFAEVYMGMGNPLVPVLEPFQRDTVDIIALINELIESADEIYESLDGALQNVVDDIKSLCYQTLYKLNNLK